ncbi:MULTISPECIES: hypothetical protein [Halobacterium]|uniref:hypothetical protein n=1 Tax=Halobacterium TaxID=2239 RepID=UPI00073E8C09|nr:MULTISPECIES: hypothetical protein [Halobacterium]MCG1002261.1 hypothetical protein [Halobacterium noricense]
MNRRTLTQWFGAALFAFAAVALAATFPADGPLAVQMVLMALAGALMFAGGVTDRVRWSLLAGLANVALGLSLVVSGVTTLDDQPGAGDLAYAALVAVGGLTLAAIGVLYVIDHDSFDTEA